MRPCIVLWTAAAVSAAVPALARDDAPEPPAKLSTCLPCHGRDGIGTAPLTPNLSGQKSLYMVKQLKAFKSGERRHSQMSLIAESLSDDDMEALSAWYEAQKPGSTP